MAYAKLASAVAAASIVTLVVASAQESPMPDDVARKLIEIGRAVDPPRTAQLYAPLQQKEPYAGVRVERDVKYGPADRNLLDVFMPETASSNRPVFIFVHGGAFIAEGAPDEVIRSPAVREIYMGIPADA